MPTFVDPINLQLFELLSARLQTLAVEPAVTPGRIYFNSTTNTIGIGNAAGTSYIYIGAAGALDAEQVQDIVGAMITGTNITVAYNDAGNTIALTVAADGSAATATLRTLGTGATQAAAGNHGHVAANISDFDSQVRTSRLDQMAAPTAAVSMNNQRITGGADPTAATDFVTKQYADALVSGLDPKGSVKAATTANITLSGAQTIDGVSVTTGDRVLVKNQTTGAQNGIYVANTGAWTRATDADSTAEVHGGLFTFVEQGTTQADTGWVLATDSPVTVGTTALSFTQFSGAGSWTAGAGLTQSGTTMNVGAGNGIIVNADTIQVDPAVVARKYSVLVGDGTNTVYTVTHNLNTRAVTATVMIESTGEIVLADVVVTGVNTLTVTFGVAPTANQYRVTVIG